MEIGDSGISDEVRAEVSEMIASIEGQTAVLMSRYGPAVLGLICGGTTAILGRQLAGLCGDDEHKNEKMLMRTIMYIRSYMDESLKMKAAINVIRKEASEKRDKLFPDEPTEDGLGNEVKIIVH